MICNASKTKDYYLLDFICNMRIIFGETHYSGESWHGEPCKHVIKMFISQCNPGLTANRSTRNSRVYISINHYWCCFTNFSYFINISTDPETSSIKTEVFWFLKKQKVWLDNVSLIANIIDMRSWYPGFFFTTNETVWCCITNRVAKIDQNHNYFV